MKRIYAKLIVIALQLILAVSVVAVSTYAWLVISANPTVEGLQIAIGGGNTILVAADLTEEAADGTVYHYPGKFQDTLNLNNQYLTNGAYEYLDDLAALTPVSTADGIHWYLPTYYGLEDQEVKDGKVLAGTLKELAAFRLDDELAYANLTSEQAEEAAQGHYVYLDFWVCSPGADYTLRLSTGEEDSGSCVVSLLQATETTDGYTLTAAESDVSSCVRVGFLVNPYDIVDDTMLYYQESAAYAEQYTKLRGNYTEQSSGYQVDSDQYRFYIYEPNGDAHTNNDLAEDGTYVVTTPVGLDENGQTAQVDIRDRLTVQKRSSWAMAESPDAAESGAETLIEQLFQTALVGIQQSQDISLEAFSPEELTKKFYEEYLGNQFSAYVDKGQFVKSTENLYNAASVSGTASADYLGEEFTAGATDDAYIITLQKNVPQRIRMFVWVEGADVDCASGISASAFAMQLELAGSNTTD